MEADIYDAVIRGGSIDLSAVAVWLDLRGLDWCIIGDMAADAWAPTAIYTHRLDVAVDAATIAPVLADLAAEGFAVVEDILNRVARLTRPGDGHRLHVALRYGPDFASMPARTARCSVLGQTLPMAALADVIQGLALVRAEPSERPQVQRKAELDLFRLAEAHPFEVDALLPADLRIQAEEDRAHALVFACGDGWEEGDHAMAGVSLPLI